MMAEFRWIKMSLFLILMLQFTAAGQLFRSRTFRVGDDITLSCENVIDDQNNCDSTVWLFGESRSRRTVVLVDLGKIAEEAKSDRLSVAENCSLVIKKVTDKDVGRYACRQFRSAKQQGQDSDVHLSVVTMTEQKDTDEVTLNCSVRTYEQCPHTVKWLFQGQDVDKDNKDIKTSQSLCSASVTFLTSLYIYTSRYKLFTCAVTDGDRVQVFPFRSQSSGEKPGEDTTTIATTTVATATASATNDASNKGWWLRFLIVSVGLSVLIISVVAVNMWTRTKEKKTQMDEITVRYDENDGTVIYENIRPSDGV
ncbi:uncharacterized protein LOC125896883 isoform X1 [Epinephelus fuscoguttatus]|uniref:uncharacterized protein LOC125896883 isoform X1 n=1 Tax=Epinephelus fuscoguttatus TaxID=293821 RepID=UPI0020D0A1A7|nr:uncharacterized protein LOC125896883 isoform X1 [Epinephelus fuscoguttatus]